MSFCTSSDKKSVGGSGWEQMNLFAVVKGQADKFDRLEELADPFYVDPDESAQPAAAKKSGPGCFSLSVPNILLCFFSLDVYSPLTST